MLDCIAYARTNREFDAMDDLARIGIDHWRGERIEFRRLGKNRTPEPYTMPALPNYVWITVPEAKFHLLHTVRHLSPTMLGLIPSAVAAMRNFRERSDARLAEAKAIVERGKARRLAIVEYQEGEQLEIRDGPLRGMLARFRRLVQEPSDQWPSVEAEVGILGRETTVRLDPLTVRAAK